MAGAGHKLWAAGDVVGATGGTSINTYLQDQIVGVYAASANRDAAFGGAGEPTLAEGMVCFLSDVNQLQIYDGSGWVSIADTDYGSPKIVQIVSDQTETTYITSSTDFQQITDLTVDITPQSTASTLLVFASFTTSHSTTTGGFIQIQREGSAISLDPNWFYCGNGNTQYSGNSTVIICKESPASVSEQNFTCFYRSETTGSAAINRSENGAAGQTGPSTLVVMEVAG
jgi:hypothetical protein